MKIFNDGCKKAAIRRMFPVWEKTGHSIVNGVKGADVQLSSIRINTRKGLPTVLRLDGIYYDKADNYKGRNAKISRAHGIADAVIYQSCFSKIMCEKYLEKTKAKVRDIIYNGVDNRRWHNPKEHDNINIVSCAKWRRWKRLPEIIEIFDNFLEHYPEAKLHIVGPIARGSKLVKHGNVVYHNPKQRIGFDKIKEVYQTMDICLYIAKKDWCPSSVVEIIAAGIPVVTTNACGGAAEMCKLTDGCIIVTGEFESLEPDYIYKEPYNKISDKVKSDIVDAMINIVKNKIRVILPEELTIETTAKKYIDIMEKIKK